MLYRMLFIVCTAPFFTVVVKGQSPSLSITVLMDSASTVYTNYMIEMKICKPVKMTPGGNRFNHDTSTINFSTLTAEDITCGNYFSKGTPDPIPATGETLPYNKFTYTNQVFAWEEICIFRISNRSSRGWWPEMYIVLPVRYKSFVTDILLTGIKFQSGKVIFVSNINPVYDGFKMNIHSVLTDAEAVDVKGFKWRELLEKD